MQQMSEKERLEDLITRANKQYWSGEETELTDIEYDEAVRQLEAIDPSNPLVTKIAAVPTIKKKVVHEKPMLSLAKAYSLEEVLKWCKKVSRNGKEEFKIQPKYDGLSGLLENDVLSSRGDGKVGEDYSDKLPFIKFVGKARPDGSWLGEILITDEDFRWMTAAKLKGKSGNVFKNQRNAVAGIIGTDDLEHCKKMSDAMKPSGHSLMTFVDYESASWHVTLENLEDRWEEIKGLILKSGYPMDGIVIKLVDEKYADSLGYTEHHPKGAIAFKFTNQSKWSVLEGIEWTMGKEQIACIGKIHPVDISGTTVKNVKLQLTAPKSSEASAWLLNGSLQIGDEVLVERAGDIIPHVLASKPGSKRTKVVLEKCPFCGGELKFNDSSVECTNPGCRRKGVEKLMFAMVTLGFKGVGEKYAELLYDLLMVRTVEDLLLVDESMLRAHKEFGDKMVDIFLAEQKKAKEAGFQKTLVAMDIPSVGKFVAKLLDDNFSRKEIVSGKLTPETLLKVHGIGKVAAEEAAAGLADRKKEVERTMKLVGALEKKEAPSAATREEKERICFTGKMSKTRGEMEALAAENGLEPMDHVDKTTTWLVCADPASGSSKMKKAEKLGCKVISEADFFKMISK